MKILFSNLSNVKPFTKSRDIMNIEMAKLSNFLVQKHGFKTIFYGDTDSVQKFKNIPYNEIIELNDIRIKEIPLEFWSIGKLFAISKINEPFLHLDYDIFLFKKIDPNKIERNIIYFHNEFFHDKLINDFQDAFVAQPQNAQNFKNHSRNCAIIGGQNFEVLKIVCNEIIDYLINNKNYINTILNKKEIINFPKFLPAVLIEQVWIFKLLEYYKQDFYPILKEDFFKNINLESYIENICHLQETKNNPIIINTLINFNKYLAI